MIIKLIFGTLLILVTSCSSEPNTKTLKESSLSKDTYKQLQNNKVADTAMQIDKDNILGIWTDGSSENATFDIRKDSIYYVDQFISYKYSLSGDSIKIYYSDWTFNGAIKISKDTLTIISEYGTARYWRFIN